MVDSNSNDSTNNSSNTPSSVPSATSTTESDSSPPLEISDKSSDPEATAKANEYKDQGNTLLQAGKFIPAITKYSEGLEYAPNNAVLLANRALAYIRIENFGLAISDASSAITCDPQYSKSYYRRGTALFALHKFKDARKDFRKVCQLTPQSRDARAKLKQVEKTIKEEAFAKAIQAEQTQPLSETYDPNTIDIPDSYDGPHPAGTLLNDPDQEAQLFVAGHLPRDFVIHACAAFKDQKVLHRRYVARILLAVRRHLCELPSLTELEIPDTPPDATSEPRITVCGDTHGQYYDVLNIFQTNGWPSAQNPYIFNGDFVDRGSFSVEVILTYLMWKLVDPNAIHLTRGNHETKNMTRIYGFQGEVQAKYDEKIFQLFLEVFSWIPLAACIEGKILVVHGGIPVTPNVSLQDIRSVPRGMEPPDTGLMSDLLWSDPQPFPGKSPSKRGVGFAFGPDITRAFLDDNHLDLLVRSHEVKDEGYLVEHDGKCITVFSAPNYCDSMGNKGAYIHFGKDLQPQFTKFEAVPHPDIKPMAYAAGMGGLF